jgi:ProP effector
MTSTLAKKPVLRLKGLREPPVPKAVVTIVEVPIKVDERAVPTEVKAKRRSKGKARYAAVVAIRRQLIRRFPAAFKDYKSPKLPLKVGIRADLLIAAPDLDPELLGSAIAQYISIAQYIYSPGGNYHQALTEGAVRVGLDGSPAGYVTAEEAEHAAQIIKGRNK